MKASSVILALAGTLCVSVSACNCGNNPGGPDGGEDAGVDAGPTVTGETLCADLAQRECDYYVRCHSEAAPASSFDFTEGRANDQVAASERARCVARIASDKRCTVLTESLKAHRLSFDADKYLACVGAIYPADSCQRDANLALRLRCLDLPFFAASTAAGSLCTADRECAGSFCTALNVDTCGTCQSYLDGGTPCARDPQCDPAFHYCSASDGGGTCTPYKALNASCNLGDFEQEECGPGRVCAITSPFPLAITCIVGLDEGQRCARGNFECKRSPRSIPELLCAPVTTSSGSTVNQCVKIIAPSGGSCGNGETIPGAPRGPFCPDTEWCNASRCEPRKAAHQPCSADDQCAGGTRCLPSGSTSTCLPYLDTGASCGASTDCKNLLGCDGSTCSPELSLNGEPCGARTCAEGYCETSGAAPACAPYKATGASCSAQGECRSDVCSTTCRPACWASP